MEPSQREGGGHEQHSWRDSRAAAYRILRPGGRPRAWARLIGLVVVSVLAWTGWRALTVDLAPEQRAVLFLLLLAVGLWVTEAVPAFAVGLLIIGYLVFVLGTTLLLEVPFDVSPFVDTWSSQVIWIMLGGFFLAAGMSRTGLDRELLALAIRPAGTDPRRVLLAIMLMCAIASMFISNTSTTALVVGAVLPVVGRMPQDEPFGRGLMVAIPLAASVGGMGTIIGSSPNAIAVGVAEELGHPLNFVQWMLLGVPVALTLVTVAWWFLSRRFPARTTSITIEFGGEAELSSRRDRAAVAVVALVTVGLWTTTPLHGLHAAVVSLVPIVLLSLLGIVGTPQVRSLPWDTLMLVSGGLSLGAAVVETGLAARLTSGLDVLTTFGTLPVLATLALLTVVVSNFMSNTATVSLLLPIATALLPGSELEVCVVLGLSASCALLLPVSTPPNAIAVSTGAIGARDLSPGGLLVGLLGPALSLVWVLLVVRWFLGSGS